MSLKGSKTKTDYIPFEQAKKIADEQMKEGNKIFGLYIYTAIYTGLRIGDLRQLKWEQLRNPIFTVTEGKTGKTRTIAVHKQLSEAVNSVDNGINGYVFISRKNSVYGNTAINELLKRSFSNSKNNLNISSHSLRKSFGRRVYDMQPDKNNALLYLSELFNHTSPAITRKYLGIRQEEMNNIYLSL